MTHDQKLNAILNSYLYAEKLRLENDPEYKKLTFNFIVNAQIKEIEEWEKEFLKERLFEDGYLKENGSGRGQPYLLTNAGKAFIQSGGYVKQRERQCIQDEINKDNLRTNLFNRRNVVIMIILTLIIVIISLFTFILK